MSNIKSLGLLAAALSSLLVAHDADAKPRHLVVVDFDGPRQLADTGRSGEGGSSTTYHDPSDISPAAYTSATCG